MLYQSVSSQRELADLNGRLLAALRSATDRTWRNHPIGFRPETVNDTVHWCKKQGFWFGALPRDEHYWIPFGVTEPNGRSVLHIAVEINTPRKMEHRRAGLFLRDKQGKAYLAHTGRVGGGKPSINRKEFLAYHGINSRDMVEYDNGKLALLLGPIDATSLPNRIGEFVSEVAAFKASANRPRAVLLPPHSDLPFKPKFVGKMTYASRGTVHAELLHDVVLSALREKLKGYDCRYSGRHDLFIKKSNGDISVLYEVKTDCDTTSIYGGTGQLLLNGLIGKSRPRLVLVVPGKPDAQTERVMKKLHIDVLAYRWAGRKPLFPDNVYYPI